MKNSRVHPWQLIKRFKMWRLLRQIREACNESRERVSRYTPRERQEAMERAHNLMFPNGYWACKCTWPDGHLVGNGESCTVCHNPQTQTA